MKKIIMVLATLTSVSAFAGSIFTCNAPKNNANAVLAGSYAIVNVTSNSLRFQQYDKSSNSLMRDYKYIFVKIAGGQSQVTGKMMFELKETVKDYGDSINAIYADQSLIQGNAGAIMFTGQGYGWDWNFCKSNQNH